MKSLRVLLLLTALALLTGGPARAAGVYRIQPIIHLGDKIGSPPLKTRQGFWVGSLNDSGQITFVTGNSAGGPLLVRYTNGEFTPIVVAGQAAPGGVWPALSEVLSPVSMNQAGNIVFSVLDHQTNTPFGTFLWDAHTGQVSPVAAKGAPAGNNQTLVDVGGPSPAINNHDEVAFAADVKNMAGKTQSGVFFRSRDGQIQPVAVPDQPLPDGGRIQSASYPSLNDSGMIAFLATRAGDGATTAFLWEAGTLTPVAYAGVSVPNGGIVHDVWGVWVNNKNHNVLVEASVKATSTRASLAHSLFLYTNETLVPVAVADKALPDGETLGSVVGGVSAANDLGEHVFLCTLARDDPGPAVTAAYLIEPDGQISQILKSSPTSEPGAIKRVGESSTFGAALNNHGQIALVVLFAAARSSTLVLLTPE